MNGLFTSAKSAYDFIMAGNAVITLVSRASGQRYTFKVRHPDKYDDNRRNPSPMFFVSLLAGPDNTQDYQYVGMIMHNEFRLTKASRMNLQSPPVRAFSWAWEKLLTTHEIPANLEIWHEGRCGRCGRVLTVPESIGSGFGPECIHKVMGLA